MRSYPEKREMRDDRGATKLERGLMSKRRRQPLSVLRYLRPCPECAATQLEDWHRAIFGLCRIPWETWNRAVCVLAEWNPVSPIEGFKPTEARKNDQLPLCERNSQARSASARSFTIGPRQPQLRSPHSITSMCYYAKNSTIATNSSLCKSTADRRCHDSHTDGSAELLGESNRRELSLLLLKIYRRFHGFAQWAVGRVRVRTDAV